MAEIEGPAILHVVQDQNREHYLFILAWPMESIGKRSGELVFLGLEESG